MRTVVVTYHVEPEGVWADSDDVEGFVASGSSLTEVRELVRDGLAFYLDGEPFEYYEQLPGGATVVTWQGDVHIGPASGYASVTTLRGVQTAPRDVKQTRTSTASNREQLAEAL